MSQKNKISQIYVFYLIHNIKVNGNLKYLIEINIWLKKLKIISRLLFRKCINRMQYYLVFLKKLYWFLPKIPIIVLNY